MSGAKAKRLGARERVRVSWDLLPLGLLALALLLVLGQRAVVGAQRYLAEYPWLPRAVALALGGIVIAGGALALRRTLRARALRRRQHAAWLARIATLEGLRALEPAAFEGAVADLLCALGYREVAVVGGSGDLCADVACLSARGERVVVQCKRYGASRRVNSPEIQQFLGMLTIHHQAQRGLYVTTSGYTRQALTLAAQHADVLELIDGERLTELMQTVR